MELFEIVKSVACMICGESGGARKPPKPEIKRFAVSGAEARVELSLAGIKVLYGMLDLEEYYTDLAGWMEVIIYIYENEEMPVYFVSKEGKWNVDCENFAKWFSAMVDKNFGLNYQTIVLGDMPRGFHGFNLLRTENGLMCFEPNPGFGINHPFAIMDEHNYKPLWSFG